MDPFGLHHRHRSRFTVPFSRLYGTICLCVFLCCMLMHVGLKGAWTGRAIHHKIQRDHL